MIFIGAGALLWRAVAFAVDSGQRVDLVCVAPEEKLPPTAAELPVLVTTDVNADAATLLSASTDDVVWLINCPTIMRAPIVDTRFRVHNIHNGPLPGYRGLPEVGIPNAILAGETRWSATLHIVDDGIDTGGVLDTESFEIADDDTFQDVMLASLRACTTLFERNLDAVAAGTLAPAADSSAAPSGYFGRRAAAELPSARNDPNYERATALGIFAPTYRYLTDLLESEGHRPEVS